MMLIEETTIPDAALPVDAFKAHLRAGTGFAQDSLQDAVLSSFLRAAIAAIEARTSKALVERAFSLVLMGWQDAMGQVIPVAPVVALTQVVTIDHLGQETVVDAGLYRLERDTHQPCVKPTGLLLPRLPQNGSVRVEFTAGMAPAFGDIPADLAQAVLMLAAHYYEYRNDTSLSGGCMPFGVTSLIERYKSLRLRAGQA